MIDNIKYNYMNCMHPVCGGCYMRSEFYEFCNDCKNYISTDVVGFNEIQNKYTYKPKKGIPLIIPKAVRSKKVRRVN